MNHPTTQIDQPEHEQLDSSHLLSCIEQALKSKKVSRLARVLAQCESESKSAEERSPGRGTEVMTSQVPRDACKVFLSSGRSVEAEVYRQLVVERINDGDITTSAPAMLHRSSDVVRSKYLERHLIDIGPSNSRRYLRTNEQGDIVRRRENQISVSLR